MKDWENLTPEELVENARKEIVRTDTEEHFFEQQFIKSFSVIKELSENVRKDLAEHFYRQSVFFYDAWVYSRNSQFSKKRPDEKLFWDNPHFVPLKETQSATFTFLRGRRNRIYKDIVESAEDLINLENPVEKFCVSQHEVSEPFFPDNPEKNIAYTMLFLWIDNSIKLNRLELDDCLNLKNIAIYYYFLGWLYHNSIRKNCDELIKFIEKYSTDNSPDFTLGYIREDLAVYGNRILGYWYANSRGVKEFVDEWQQQQRFRSEGGKARADKYKPRHEEWRKQAKEILQRHPTWGRRSVAKQIEKITGDKWETIRKHI